MGSKIQETVLPEESEEAAVYIYIYIYIRIYNQKIG